MELLSHISFERKDTVVQSFFMKGMDVVVYNIRKDQIYVTVVLTGYFRQDILLLFCLCHHSLKIYFHTPYGRPETAMERLPLVKRPLLTNQCRKTGSEHYIALFTQDLSLCLQMDLVSQYT